MAELSDYLTSLELFRDYPVGEKRFVYRFVKEPEVVEVMKPFRIEEIAGDGDTFSKARKVMQWVADVTQYDGASPLGLAMPEQIIEFGIQKKQPGFRKSYESFDKQLTIVPRSYIECLISEKDDLQGWKEKLVNSPKITLNDLEGESEWSKGGEICD